VQYGEAVKHITFQFGHVALRKALELLPSIESTQNVPKGIPQLAIRLHIGFQNFWTNTLVISVIG